MKTVNSIGAGLVPPLVIKPTNQGGHKGRPYSLIDREFHFLQEGCVARILFNIAQQRIAFH